MKIEDIITAIQEHDHVSLEKLLKKLASKKSERIKATKKQQLSLNALVPPNNVAPLHTAAACGSPEVCRLLLDHSAFVDIEDQRGARPLHYACANAQPTLARILLDWGATVNGPIAHDGRTPLHCVVVGALRSTQLDFIRRTLSVTGELSAQARDAPSGLRSHAASELIGLLFEHDADPELRDVNARTALEYACESGNVEFLNAYLATSKGRAHLESVCTRQLERLRNASHTDEPAGAHIDWPAFTASHLAARNGHIAVLRLLCNVFISLGVLQLRSVNGTPLHEAVLNGRVDTVRFLVENGVDVSIRNPHGHTALDLTCLLEAGGSNRSLVDEIRRIFANGGLDERDSLNSNAMWRNYVTNDSLFTDPTRPSSRPNVNQSQSQSPHRKNRQSFNEKLALVDINLSMANECALANGGSGTLGSARSLHFQLPFDAAINSDTCAPDAYKNSVAHSLGRASASDCAASVKHANFGVYNLAGQQDIGLSLPPAVRSGVNATGSHLGSSSSLAVTPTRNDQPQRLCASMYVPNVPAPDHVCSRICNVPHAQTNQTPYGCSSAPQCALTQSNVPTCQCQFTQHRCSFQSHTCHFQSQSQSNANVCCNPQSASNHCCTSNVNPSHQQQCLCTMPNTGAPIVDAHANPDTHRHSSASVDSGHGSASASTTNDCKHLHSPISPCDSAVSSSRNSALSGCSGQPLAPTACQCQCQYLACPKNQNQNQPFQQHASCCHNHPECNMSNANRCVPNPMSLNVSLPSVTLTAANVISNPAGSTAGSSSGSSSQGDMESGVSFSSMSSLENIDEYFLEDPLDLNALFADGLSDNDVLQHWLNALQLPEYYKNFVAAGYDIATISRMTPEDLTAIGITNPKHRRRLRAELRRLNVDIPNYSKPPASLYEWLASLHLECYHRLLASQGYTTLEQVAQGLTWDDMEDIGVVLLGHQKKLTLAISRLRKLLQSYAPQTQPRDPVRPHELPNAVSTLGHITGATAVRQCSSNIATFPDSTTHCPHGNCQCSRRDQSTNMNAAEKVLADILNTAEHRGAAGNDLDSLSTSPADGSNGLPATLKSLRTLDRLRETAELSRSCNNVNVPGSQMSEAAMPFCGQQQFAVAAPASLHAGGTLPFMTSGVQAAALASSNAPNSNAFAANLQAAYSALRGMQQRQSTAAADCYSTLGTAHVNCEQNQQVAPQSANSTPMHRASPQVSVATTGLHLLQPQRSAASQPYASPLLSRHQHCASPNAPLVPKRQQSLPVVPPNGCSTPQRGSALPPGANELSQVCLASELPPSSSTALVSAAEQKFMSTGSALNSDAVHTNRSDSSMHYRTLPHLHSHSQRINSVPEQEEGELSNGSSQNRQGQSNNKNNSNAGSAQNLRGSSASIDSVTTTIPFANDNCGTIRQRPNASAQYAQAQIRGQHDERNTSNQQMSCSSQSLTSSPTLRGSTRNSANEHGCFSPGSSLSSSSSSCSSANTVLHALGTLQDQESSKSTQNLDDLNSILNNLSSAFDTVLRK